MRTVLILLLASGLALTAGAVATESALTNAGARVHAEPFVETVFGTRVDDPYRWMEAADRQDEVVRFIRDSSAHTTAQLAALPGHARLRARNAQALAGGTRYGDVHAVGDRLFYRRTDPGAQLAKLVVREADGRERVLYDAEAGATRGPAINSYSVSPTGERVALHTAAGGAEIGAIRFLDVATGSTLPDTLEPVWGEFEAAWLAPDTVAYTRMASTEGPDPMAGMRVLLHRIGRTGDDVALLGPGAPGPSFQPQEFPLISEAADSEWTLGYGGGARADGRVFVARHADVVAGRPRWRELGGYEDQLTGAALSGDRLYLMSTRDAPNGKVLRIDLRGGGGLESAETVLPAGDGVLTGIAATADGLYISSQRDGLSRLLHLSHAGGAPRPLALPLEGNLAGLQASGDGRAVTFALQDWFTAPAWYRADRDGIRPLGLASATDAGAARFSRLDEQATSADGTRVPLSILLPPGAPATPPRAVLLDGYGSYGMNSAEPFYAPHAFGLLEEGAAIAYCGTRGGGERGRSWHEAGRAANKPKAHADLIACGERLVELGLARPERMTVMGTSAGGLLAPPAALARPDLFGALIANVAILNPTRLAVAPNGPNQFGEMGDPTTEAGFKGLLPSDAYVLLEQARDMPDTLLLVGLNDKRVAPWFSSKFAARALDRFGDRRLVLLRTDPDAGHGVGSATDQRVAALTDAGSFVLNRAGVEGFTAP